AIGFGGHAPVVARHASSQSNGRPQRENDDIVQAAGSCCPQVWPAAGGWRWYGALQMAASGAGRMTTALMANSLAHNVLVLNRFYMAVHVVNVRRAITLLFRNLAEVIHIESGQYANYDFVSWREISQLRSAFDEQDDDEEVDW